MAEATVIRLTVIRLRSDVKPSRMCDQRPARKAAATMHFGIRSMSLLARIVGRIVIIEPERSDRRDLRDIFA